jgi:hypothetical protein
MTDTLIAVARAAIALPFCACRTPPSEIRSLVPAPAPGADSTLGVVT